MNKENEVKALFVLCQDLKAQVKNLTEKVEALSEVQTTSNCNCSKEISDNTSMKVKPLLFYSKLDSTISVWM